MVLNYFSQPDRAPDSTEFLKDSRFKTVLVGYAIPLCILSDVIVNLLTGRVWLPADRMGGDLFDGLVQSYPTGWLFAGVVTLKCGLAAGLWSWYGLANHARTEAWSQVALLVSLGVAAVGVIMFGVGFFY